MVINEAKAVPFVAVVIFGLLKLALIMPTHNRFDVAGWLVFSIGWAWITWAYWKDKDMPAYSGNFDYKNGENDFPRAMYVVAMVACYVIGLVWA